MESEWTVDDTSAVKDLCVYLSNNILKHSLQLLRKVGTQW